MKEVDKAYIAGFVDGEGCISVRRDRRNRTNHKICEVTIGNTNKDILDWISTSLDAGRIHSRKRVGNHKIVHTLTIVKIEDVKRTLVMLKPYIKVKAMQAAIVLELLGEGYSGELDDILLPTMKNLNHRGMEVL